MQQNYIHPTATIGQNIKLGQGNYIGPYCFITGNTTIGSNNRFEAFCSIGTPGEHRDYFHNTDGELRLGDNNVFREYSSINIGTTGVTTVGSNVTLLTGAHISHDCTVADRVTLSHHAVLGGHTRVMEGVNLGIGATCHQYSVLGAYAMVGMGGVVLKSSRIEPGNIYIGVPVQKKAQNIVGLQRAGITLERLEQMQVEYESNL